MNADMAAWLSHPMTFGIVAAFDIALFLVTELLLRGLAGLGNVRFQGVLDDNPKLFPVIADETLHLSLLIASLRWLNLGAAGLLWLILVTFPGMHLGWAFGLAIAVPVACIAVAAIAAASLSEDAVAKLLLSVRPLVAPIVAVLVRLQPAASTSPPEIEEEEASEREIQAFLEAGQAAGIIEGEEGEFLESLVEFFDTVVREVMTPRTDMVAVPESIDFDELMATFASSHKSRIPVFQETIDRVVGVVHVKNVVEFMISGERPPLSDVVRECLVVPETKELGELLRDFQRERQQLAIVVDEYGGTSGLVTLEDILEEIVGEIQDEHDASEPPDCEEIVDGVYRLLGRAPLEVLEDIFEVDVAEEEVDTVGGLVFSRHGTVPEPGVEVIDDIRQLHFVVDEMDERRILSVTVRKYADDEDPQSEGKV